MQSGTAALHAQLIQRSAQQLLRIGQVLHKFDVHVEADQERQVFLMTQHLREELKRCSPLRLDHALLADTRVDEQSDRQGQICLTCEIANRLSTAFFFQDEVFLRQVGHQATLLVPNGGHHIDHIHVDRNRDVFFLALRCGLALR